MRSCFVPVLFALALVPPCLAAQRSAEQKHPEIVYYANAYADHYHVPRALVHAVITQESGWNRNALSSKGAAGLLQLLPATAARFAVRGPQSISDNISGGVQYLALLMSMFRGDLRMAVADYYCGEHHIQHRGLAYKNPEVIAYVLAVKRLYDRELQVHQPPNR